MGKGGVVYETFEVTKLVGVSLEGDGTYRGNGVVPVWAGI